MQKAILLSLDDTYEEELISSTGKHKEDYIGQVGNIVHRVDREQIEFVGENE